MCASWFSILGWSLSILTITGNGFIICLVSRRRRLRRTNAFIVSLAAADFCVGLITFPPLFVCEEIIGCNPKAFLASGMDYLRWLFGYASVTNLCGLVLERYVAVVKPLSYLTFMTRKRVLQMFVISWTIPVILVLAFLLNGLVFKETLLFKVLTLITIVFLEFLPCCGLIFCFASMYYFVYKHIISYQCLKEFFSSHQSLPIRISFCIFSIVTVSFFLLLLIGLFHFIILQTILSVSQFVPQSVNKLVSETFSPSISQSVCQSVSKSVDQLVSQSLSQSINQFSFSPSVTLSVSPSLSRSVSQSVS